MKNMSLSVRQGVKAAQRGFLWLLALLVLAALAGGLFLPGRPWASAALGAVASAAVIATSMFTTGKFATSQSPRFGWIALDYGVKLVAIAGSLILAKNVAGLDVKVVGALVILAIAGTTAVQLVAFRAKSAR